MPGGLLGEIETGPLDASLTLNDLLNLLTWGISFGVPISIDSTGAVAGQQVANIRGSWVTLTLSGATGTATVTHNMNIPPTSVTGGAATANLPNVRWFLVGVEYGDRTGNNAAPASPAAFVVSLFKLVNATVTADAIDLQYRITGVVPSATEPVSVTLFMVPAVQ